MAHLDPAFLHLNYELEKHNQIKTMLEGNNITKNTDTNNETSEKIKDKKIKKKNMKKRCNFEGCNKKLGLMPFTCECSQKFCALHRLPEAHLCTFNHMEKGKNILRKNNPRIQNAKITEI